jgi:hypothetical protein
VAVVTELLDYVIVLLVYSVYCLDIEVIVLVFGRLMKVK